MDKNFSVLPTHIAVIMDGNGRWARQKGMERTEGHKAGEDAFVRISTYCASIGIPYATFYAFSTENWKRSEQEVSAIMNVFRHFLSSLGERIRSGEAPYRIRFIGDRGGMPDDIASLMEYAEKASASVEGTTVTVALNYGGRDEIVRGVRNIAERVKAGEISPDEITEDVISASLDTSDIPDPDLIIRPSGESRLSNFLLWQSAYAEIFVDGILWPDYMPADLDRALKEYGRRNRRFGGI